MTRQSIFQAMKKAGCTYCSHESDLYVEDSRIARHILGQYPTERANSRTFVSKIDGNLWIDIPFAYDPWWHPKKD